MKDGQTSTIYKKKGPLFLFLIPAFAFLAVYLFYPFLINVVNSFEHIAGLGQKASGWNDPWYLNYKLLVTDPIIKTALQNTLLMMLCTVVFQVGIALILALLVDSIRVGGQFFRTVYFFPIVISATALGLMFNLIFLYNGGFANSFLSVLFPGGQPIDWKDQSHWFFTMTAPVMWQYVGFYFVIIVTGLNNISSDIYEAAAIDAASGLQVVLRIKLPLLHNTLVTCLILAITGALKVFDLPWTMFQNGIPLDASWLTGTYMYKQSMGGAQNVDYASTISLLIVVLGVLVSQCSNMIFKEKDY